MGAMHGYGIARRIEQLRQEAHFTMLAEDYRRRGHDATAL